MSTASAAAQRGPIGTVSSTTIIPAAAAAAAAPAPVDAPPADAPPADDAAAAAAAAAANGGAAITDDQMKEYFKAKGIEYDGDIEALKNKLKPVAATLTPEEEEKKKVAFELRMANLYVERGGTLESFQSIKEMMSADPNELSRKQLEKQLIENGVEKEDAVIAVKQMVLAHDLENLEQGTDEDDTAFEKRKAKLQKEVDAGAKVMANLGLPIIQKAKSIYESLENQVKAIDSEAAEEAELSSNIDAYFKELPREMSLEIGKINEKDIPAVKVPISEEAIASVLSVLKDPKKRDALFYDENGNFNVKTIAGILVRNAILEATARQSLIEGQNRQVEILKERFPNRSAQGLGVGGATKPGSKTGVVTAAGKAQRV